jgi:glyoxylase-like metal-dependent hydrolase (beta-lactamase superfamily II)
MIAWTAPPDSPRPHGPPGRRRRRASDRQLTWRGGPHAGHTAGHMCLEDADRRVLFSGDEVLPTVCTGTGLAGRLETNPVADYLTSLERTERFDDFEIIPGHGERFRGLRWQRHGAVEHTLRRAREVSAVVASDRDATVWEVASRLTWTAGWGAARQHASALLRSRADRDVPGVRRRSRVVTDSAQSHGPGRSTANSTTCRRSTMLP